MPSVSSTDGSQASPKNLFSVQMQVHGAHGLRSADFHGTSDPYVAIRYKGLLLGKTTVKRKTLSPDWGSQTFVFGPVHQHRQLQVEVWDCDPLGFDECLGCVVLMVEKVSYNKKAFSLRSRPYKDDSGVSGTITLTYEMKSVSSQQQRSSSGSNKHIKVSAEGIFSQPSPFKRGVSVRSNSASSSSSSKLDLHGELASGNISVVIKNLTSENANVRNKQQETLLHKACSLGNEELFKALVEKKADLNLQDKDGWTPLHCAASKAAFHLCSLLIDHKADLDVLNRDGTSAVHYLVRAQGKVDIPEFEKLIQKLKDNNANLNCQNKNGETPLLQAIVRRNIWAAKVLLEQGASPSAVTSFGETPLSLACQFQLKEAIEMLMNFGADPSLVKTDGLPEEIIALLKKKKKPGDDKAFVRLIPIRCQGLIPPKTGGKRANVTIEAVCGKESKRALGEGSSKANAFKWNELNFDFPLTEELSKTSKIKIKLLDVEANESLGYIGFVFKDLPEFQNETGAGLHVGWHPLRKCSGQTEVSGKLRFGLCYLDKDRNEIGVKRAKKPSSAGSMASISIYGVLRGECTAAGCDCEVYQPGASSGGPCFNCGHYPTKHMKIGGESKKKSAKKTRTRTIATKAVAKKVEKVEKEEPKPKKEDSLDSMLTASWAVDPKEITLIEPPLGEGTFAKVYRGTYRGQQVAVKVLKSKVGPKQLDEFQKEFAIMSAIRTPHVVFFYGACVNPTLYMVMEFCSRGTLFDVLKNEKDVVDWKLALKLATDSVRGIWCLHSWKPQIVHRDLKSLNLLVDENFTVKVCDFGQSRFTEGDAKNASTLGKLRGTYHYCAPEVYFGKTYTTKADVFSLAIILWEIVFRTMTGTYLQPYGDHPHLTFDFQIIIQTAKKGLRPSFPEGTPEHWIQMISLCWDADPLNRPECPQILEALTELSKEFEQNKEEWESKRVEKKEESESESDSDSDSDTYSDSSTESSSGSSGSSDDSDSESESDSDDSDSESESDSSESESDSESSTGTSESESESESDTSEDDDAYDDSDSGPEVQKSTGGKKRKEAEEEEDTDSDSDSDSDFGSGGGKKEVKKEVVKRVARVSSDSDSDSSSDDDFGS